MSEAIVRCNRPNQALQPTPPMHGYEVRPRKDKRGVDLICDALPFGRLWYGEPNAIPNAIGYAIHRSRSHDAVIRVYDAARQCGRYLCPTPTTFCTNASKRGSPRSG